MEKVSKVLLDTCFLIELADKSKPLHKEALDYYNYFGENNIDCFLSPIVVSEYWHNDLVEDFQLENFKHLTFGLTDGYHTGRIARTLKNKNGMEAKGIGKDAIKDDFKLLAQLIVNNSIDCFITLDSDIKDKYVDSIIESFPSLRQVSFINIRNLPIEKTFRPQKQISFPD